MATPSQAVLKANAILCSKKTNKLFCFICNANPNSKGWKSHIETRRHVAMLDKFKETFDNREENAWCKICKSFVTWDTIMIHGESHMIVPWYNPNDKYKIFYENHTLKYRTQYYCYLCDEIFPEWSSAYVHIGDEKHQNIVRGVHQTVPTRGSKKFYRDMTASGFVPGRDGTVECRFCGNTDLGYHITIEHRTGSTHAINKSKFIDKLLKRTENDNTAKRVAESSESKESSSMPVEPQASEDVRVAENISAPANRPMICNFLLEQDANEGEKILDKTETRKQAEEEKIPNEATSPNRVEKVSGLYHEYMADFVVSGSHALCKEAKAKSVELKRGKIVKHIMDDPDPYCLICCFEIPGYAAAKDHVRGKLHANSCRRYGCENIVLVEDTRYHCISCDRVLTDFEKVYRHVIDNSHTRLIDLARSDFDDDEVVRVVEEIPNGMEITREAENSDSRNENCIYIVRRNAKKSFCQICDDTQYPVASKNIKEHIAGQRHKVALMRYGCDNIVARANNYHCRCCDSKLCNLEDVHLHVKDKRHMRSMIRVAHKKEPQTPKRIRDKFETQEYLEDVASQQPCINLLSDYIFDKIPSCSSSNIAEPAQPGTANNFFHGQNFDCSSNPNRFEPPKQARPSKQPNFRKAFDNNNIAQPAAANTFWKFPSKIEAPRQAALFEQPIHRNIFGGNIVEPKVAATYSRPPNIVEPPKNPLDLPASSNGMPTDQKSVQPELSAMLSSMASQLSRLLELTESNQTKKVQKPRIDERIRGQEKEVPVKRINCNLCDLFFCDTTHLHVHMASHFSEEFVRPKRNRSMNGMINNYSSNDQNLQNGIEGWQLTSEPGINGNVLCNNVDDCLPLNVAQNGDDMTNSMLKSTTAELGSFDPGNAVQDIEPTFPPARHTVATPLNNNSPRKQQHSPKKANIKKVIELLDFDYDYIYEMKDKLADVELGMKLCFIIDSNNIYCLICQKTVETALQNYFEHLCSVEHCEYLEIMEQDSKLFNSIPNQFSDMDLAHEYIQEISDDAVRCFICDREIPNKDRSIEEHIYDENHVRKFSEMRTKAMKIFDDIKPRIRCDWYNVQKYWCVLCSMNTGSEVNFVKHLKSVNHAKFVKKLENYGKRLIFDFCAPCALLWYGYRCTYSYHSEIEEHKWLTRDGYYASPALPRFSQSLLAAPEDFIENKVKYLNEISESEREKEGRLIRDMETAVKMKFSRAKAYTFGSRISGLESPDSDIDVYLDCRNTYDGNDTSESQILYFMTGVHQCLIKDAQTWDVEELLTTCRSPIIRAYHRATGLNCDISFQNGLSVENSKLIKTINNVFPTCRKLILFLKQWVAYCDLAGSNGITSYALYWYVIFYLQKESILPSIATLIAMNKKSHIIAGWEVGVSRNFTYNKQESNYSIKEFLTRFFKFYTDFDYRHYVASPLLGEELKKREFAEPQKLPKAMALYVNYIRNSEKNPEPFQIDSTMCIQDPFDLQHNLTKAVSKVYVNRFRTYCSKSLDLLCSM